MRTETRVITLKESEGAACGVLSISNGEPSRVTLSVGTSMATMPIENVPDVLAVLDALFQAAAAEGVDLEEVPF